MIDMKSIRFQPPVAGDMVRAIPEDRKTVTRRVVKLKYSNTHLEMFTNKYGTRLVEKRIRDLVGRGGRLGGPYSNTDRGGAWGRSEQHKHKYFHDKKRKLDTKCRTKSERGVEMSKKKYWWGHVRYLIRKYPEWGKMPYEEMTRPEMAGWDAVNKAIKSTERMTDGASRLKVVQAMHWGGGLNLDGASVKLHCGRATAARWQSDFFKEVAKNMAFIE